MFFPEPKNQGNVFNPASYDCNNCCGGGDGAQGPAGPAAPSYKFQGSITSGTVIPANQIPLFPPITSITNPQGWFNTSNYRYTPQVAGYYSFTVTAAFNAVSTINSNQCNVQIFKNGASGGGGIAQVYPNTLNQSFLNLTAMIFMNGSTDYANVNYFTDSTGMTTQQGSLFVSYLGP